MTGKVVDASAVVAVLFNEMTRASVVARLRGFALYAPSLLEFEVASACLKRMRAVPAEREALLQGYSLLKSLSIELQPVDLVGAITLAERAGLSVYDGSYLWLARALQVELVTLDARLARADEALRAR